MAANRYPIQEIPEHQLTMQQFQQISRLEGMVWVQSDRSPEELAQAAFDASRRQADPWSRRYMIIENDEAIAGARIFPREIFYEADGRRKSMMIMALRGVCVNPDLQGRGLGRIIVEHVFRLLPDSPFALSLFQTDVPGFYEKLGSRKVPNNFYNSQNLKDPQAWPWGTRTIMIHPGEANFPAGPIDLNGEGY